MNEIEQLLRTLAPAVLGPLVRRYGGFDTCEDAVQEALLAAARQWPAEGVPENPRGGWRPWPPAVASSSCAPTPRGPGASRPPRRWSRRTPRPRPAPTTPSRC